MVCAGCKQLEVHAWWHTAFSLQVGAGRTSIGHVPEHCTLRWQDAFALADWVADSSTVHGGDKMMMKIMMKMMLLMLLLMLLLLLLLLLMMMMMMIPMMMGSISSMVLIYIRHKHCYIER